MTRGAARAIFRCMNAITTILATAAITAGTLQAIKAARRRFASAPDDRAWLKKRRSSREDGIVVDLEVDEATGVYGLGGGRR